MQVEFLRRLFANESYKVRVLVILWAVSISSILAQALFQRSSLTIVDHALIFALCVLAGAMMIDIGDAILGYVAAMILGLLILFLVATLPASLGTLAPPANVIIYSLWISIIFKSVFPFPFIAYLIAAIIGSGLGERYL